MENGMASIDGARIRRVLGPREWSAPFAYGPDGWVFKKVDAPGSVIATCADIDDVEWVHASIAFPSKMPSYDDLKLLHRAVFRDGWAYQVFAPASDHVNIHRYALHLYGRLDGAAALPDFTLGTSSI